VQLIDATQWYKPLRKNLGKKNCELSEEDIDRICQTFLAFEETEESKIFPNKAFGYWKVTVERPLRIKGIDPERAYKTAEVKRLKETHERAEDAPAVIKKIRKAGVKADPLHGLFEVSIGGRNRVVEYEPDTDLRDTEQIPLLEEGDLSASEGQAGIDAFIRREVLPYAPDLPAPSGARQAGAWIVESSIKIGYEISFNRYFYKPKAMRSLDEIRADLLKLQEETEGLLQEIVGGE